MQVNPVTRIVGELHGRMLCVFCGAGTSLYSGIPLAAPLIQAILDSLGLRDDEKQEFLAADLPFESVIEILIDATSSEHLFKVFKCEIPNRNHIFFAELAARGLLRAIITTNFDILVEKALSDKEIPYYSYYSDKDLADVNWNSEQLPIIKLHGDITDTQSLAITIRRVASRVLVSSRNKVIQQIFSQPLSTTLVVMGYSCSDRFDITPTIRSLGDKTQTVVFIEHTPVPASEASVTVLSAVEPGHPFYGFDGYMLRCNTDDFVDEIWRKFIQSKTPTVKSADHDWRSMLNQWLHSAIAQKGICISSYIAAMLFKGSGSYETSNIFLHRTLAAEPSPDIEAAAYQTLGDNHRDMGELEEALRYLRKALTSSQEHNLLWRQARALSSLGIVTEDQKNHQWAISYYKRAMKLARLTGDKELLGKCNGNIGIAYKNIGEPESIKKAIRYQENALQIARDLGDKRSEGRTLGNLGIAYSNLGDKMRAIAYYSQAKAIAEDLRDSRHIGIWLANSGMDYVGIDDSEALHQLNEAVAIFDKLGLPHYIAECERYLSQINGTNQPDGSQSAGPASTPDSQGP